MNVIAIIWRFLAKRLGMTADASQNVTATGKITASGGLDAGTNGITNTGAIAGATTIDASGLITASGGTLNVGVDDTQRGTVNLYGNATGSASGGRILFYIAADHDSAIQAYSISVNEDQLKIEHSGGTLLSFLASRDILVYAGNELRFRDAAIYIASLNDGHLDLGADAFIDLNGAVTAGDGGTTNYLEITATGDIIFHGSAGMCYGEIWFKDNATPTTLNSDAEVQITDFDNDGEEHNTDADHTNAHIVIQKAGRYLVTVSLTAINGAAQSHTLDISCFKNDGTVELQNLHAHRSLAGGSGDVGAMSLSGIVNLVVDDTLELWATTGVAADRDVIFEDCTMSVTQIGG